jgi:UDP-N-acetylmuramoyl-L-alanyl-D-glutamate--2,6-diaminopimelate ligase
VKQLEELARAVRDAEWTHQEGSSVAISGISRDSRTVSTGELFIAIPGTRIDSHEHIDEAVVRGAAAVVVERPVPDPGVPVVRVPDSRIAFAELAAEWYGRPAEKLLLVGITGTLGKTSVLAMLEAILRQAEIEVATIGSLGIRIEGTEVQTGHTVPGALTLQRALARGVECGAEIGAMEVTSHALVQERVHGLNFHLGIFTNLVPLEHMEYHGSFAEYTRAKVRFFDHLLPTAPLVYSSDNLALATLVNERGLQAVGCGTDEQATARIEKLDLRADGTRFQLHLQRTLPAVRGEATPPGVLPLSLRLLGRSNAVNAALAATAALCLGAPGEAVRYALERMEPPPRRMNVVHRGSFTVIDDTVGHPDSITAVFQVAEALPHERLHVVYAIRGQRGPEINQSDADALALWAERVGVASLFVTPSADAADERNTVAPEEREAFVGRLEEVGCAFVERTALAAAVHQVLTAAGEGDLILLLGAQGMDSGAELVRRHFAR